jgi:hypothetical protein
MNGLSLTLSRDSEAEIGIEVEEKGEAGEEGQLVEFFGLPLSGSGREVLYGPRRPYACCGVRWREGVNVRRSLSVVRYRTAGRGVEGSVARGEGATRATCGVKRRWGGEGRVRVLYTVAKHINPCFPHAFFATRFNLLSRLLVLEVVGTRD